MRTRLESLHLLRLQEEAQFFWDGKRSWEVVFSEACEGGRRSWGAAHRVVVVEEGTGLWEAPYGGAVSRQPPRLPH